MYLCLLNLFVGLDKPNVDGTSFNSFGVAEEQPAAEPSTEEGESSDANLDCHVINEPLERKAEIGLEYLDSSAYQYVLVGFNRLIKCASLPGGPLAVFNARFTRPPPAPPAPPIKVIPTVIEKAQKQDPQFSKLAVRSSIPNVLCSTLLVLIF